MNSLMVELARLLFSLACATLPGVVRPLLALVSTALACLARLQEIARVSALVRLAGVTTRLIPLPATALAVGRRVLLADGSGDGGACVSYVVSVPSPVKSALAHHGWVDEAFFSPVFLNMGRDEFIWIDVK